MERTRSTKMIAIVALVFAVIGVSVGFAAFSTTLNISDAQALVGSNAGNNEAFKNSLKIKSVSCTQTAEEGAAIGNISSDGFSWTGAQVTLSKPNDTVTCTAVVENTSEFDAYLTGVSIAGSITCDGTGNNVANACNSLKLTATGKGSGSDAVSSSATARGTTITNNTTITGNKIVKTNGQGSISFTVLYEGTSVSDGDFTATLPAITFSYSTVDNQ